MGLIRLAGCLLMAGGFILLAWSEYQTSLSLNFTVLNAVGGLSFVLGSLLVFARRK